MAYHDIEYLLIFLPAVLLAYQLVPKKKRWIVLLAAGYAFFYAMSKKLVIFLIGTTIWVHYIGIWIQWLKMQCHQELDGAVKGTASGIKKRYKQKEKHVLIGGILLVLGVLVYLKYYNFFTQNINGVVMAMGKGELFQAKRLILPIGISFYTLQAISYMVDVYWDKIPAEKHLGKLALFLGFFPQIMEGPISMYSQTAQPLWEGKSLKIENLTQGCVRILLGLFKKMIIADRLYMLVVEIFENYQQYSGMFVVVAAIAYTIQLYMEFSGCMDIVIGSGKLFGVTLPENFRQPFFSKNAAEFWRRWHMTLGVWFKTYVFYPVSASKIVKKWNKFGRKHVGKHMTKIGVSAIALFPVWFCNGLWHGARWSYIFYGMYYFVILLFGIIVEPARNKFLSSCHIDEDVWYWKTLRVLKTWVIIFTGEMFFRANGLRAGMHMFFSIWKNFDIRILWNGVLLEFGLDQADYGVIIVGCIIIAMLEIAIEKKRFDLSQIQNFRLPVRWAIYYGLILAVIIFGAYGIGYQQVDLIYANF